MDRNGAKDWPLMEGMWGLHIPLENVARVVEPIGRMAKFVFMPEGVRTKFDDMGVQQTAANSEILNLIRKPQPVRVVEYDGNLGEREVTREVSFGEALENAILQTESWLSNSASRTKQFLMDYWAARYGQGSQKAASNSEWYDARMKTLSEYLVRLKELKALADDQDPLSTNEKSVELLGRMLSLPIDAGYMNTWVSGISKVLSDAYQRKKVAYSLKRGE